MGGVEAAKDSAAIASGAHSHEGQRYRADIDGLRALAVLPILLNHVGVRGFGGGYVGVDIFFVISGYLITGILSRDLAKGRFSIAEFYRRRILRIFPALFAMLAVTSAIAFFALMPGELVRFARSVGASTLFASNILFYTEAGYFDTASHAKPLLHTWSLGIEEQFYILWPWLLLAVTAIRPRLIPAAIAVITLVSLAASVVMVRADMTAAFYLLPSRAWELGLGGLIAVLPFRFRNRWINEALAIMGMAMICYAVWRFFIPIVFPGLTALVPCGGAALLILSGPNTFMGRALSLWPPVLVGRISYSLYLWHWPVIVFAELWLFLDPTGWVVGGEIVLSFVLAYLSWRYIETPFRDGTSGWPTRNVLLAGVAAILGAVLIAKAMTVDHGLSSRFTPRQVALDAFAEKDYEASFRRGTCFIIEASDAYDETGCLTPHGKHPVLLLLGDSMAAHYWPGLSLHQNRFDVLQATMAGCRPNIYPADTDRRCEIFFRRMLLDWAPRHKPAVLMLSGNWQPMDLPLLEKSLPQIKRLGIRLLLVGPVPQYSAAVPRLLVFADRKADAGLPNRAALAMTVETDRTMAQMAEKAGVAYVSPLRKLCPDGICRRLATPAVPLQFDYGHLSPQGSAMVINMMMPDIDRVARTDSAEDVR